MEELLKIIFMVIVFPGFLTMAVLGMAFHWIDRKLIAKFEGRVGPPWYQPLADLIKLFAKEDILPSGTNETFALLLPLISFSSVLTAGFYVLNLFQTPVSFEGDFIMIIFLLSLPSLLFFLGGWTTSGVYSILGGNRSLLQYFSYEVLFMIALSGAAIANGSWSLEGIRSAQENGLSFVIPQMIGFMLSMAGLIGKLKRSPYDIPKAKSEMIVGPLTEFSGKKLAMWMLTDFVQTVAGIAFLVHCYFAGLWAFDSFLGIVLFIGLMLLLQFILSLVSAIFARLRIDQLINLNWRVFIPLSILQNLLIIIL
jgi:NADH-quinone oxidoreductase subunit H